MALRFVPSKFKDDELCEIAYENKKFSLIYATYNFVTEEKCAELAKERQEALLFFPDKFITKKVCNQIFNNRFIFDNLVDMLPERIKTTKFFEKLVSFDGFFIKKIDDKFKTPIMINNAIKRSGINENLKKYIPSCYLGPNGEYLSLKEMELIAKERNKLNINKKARILTLSRYNK